MGQLRRLSFRLALGGMVWSLAQAPLAGQKPSTLALEDLPTREGICRVAHPTAERAKVMGYVDAFILVMPDTGRTVAGRSFSVGTDSVGRLTKFSVGKSWFMPPRDSIESVDLKFGPDGAPEGRITTIARDRSKSTRPYTSGDLAAARRLAAAVIAKCRPK